jgi:hypothetical protein
VCHSQNDFLNFHEFDAHYLCHRNLLALVAAVRYSGKIYVVLREYGVFGLLKEILKRLKKTFFDIVKSAPIIGGIFIVRFDTMFPRML